MLWEADAKMLGRVVGTLNRKWRESERLWQELEGLMKKMHRDKDMSEGLLTIPPCKLDSGTFSLKYGLVKIHRDQMPHYDQFRLREMELPAVNAVHLLASIAVGKAVRALEDPRDHGRGIQKLLLTTFRDFTSPLPEHAPVGNKDEEALEEFLEGDGEVRRMLRSILSKRVRRVVRSDMPLRSSEGFLLGNAEEEILNLAEEDEDVEDPTRTKTLDSDMQHRHSDMLVKVYSKGRRKELRVAVSFKTSANSENLYQPAAFVIKSLARAPSKEHWPPVCIQVWDKLRWYYGYIEIQEFVRVEDEELVEESLACFPLKKKEELVTGTVRPSQRMVQNRFAEWKTELHGQEMKIPDGRYPVGELFIHPGGETLPDFSVAKKLSEGLHLFYEGMLKTLVGREVTKWTPRDVYSAYYRRGETAKMARKIGIPEDQWEYVPGLMQELKQDVENIIATTSSGITQAQDLGM
ncbi:hypothetical protein SELMODRAFT_406874 [Selaginella moellendorffii]|uniref:Uncharacterized protein n=1 Tax=Selaginella moellendorffii TaxID=88036 RepID=D8R378_SELML|nr:hypothetical protein SELMODRAFT_406874 [Selaginella moellendorffii]